MSQDWYLITPTGLSFEEDEFNFDKARFTELINSFVGSDIQIYGDRITNTPTEKRALIQQVTQNNVPLLDIRSIQCAIGTLACGQYIKISNQWWLVATAPASNRVYERAILWCCQYPLKFTVPGTSTVVEYPIPTESASNGSGEKALQYITIGATQRAIYLPYNEVTAKIDNGYRFLIDRRSTNVKAYKVTNVDTTSYMYGTIGLVRLVCDEDPLRSADNLATKVANNAVPSDGNAGGDGDWV
jgi:hypothetical protein